MGSPTPKASPTRSPGRMGAHWRAKWIKIKWGVAGATDVAALRAYAFGTKTVCRRHKGPEGRNVGSTRRARFFFILALRRGRGVEQKTATGGLKT
ncbi:MAG: hypothetical protein SF052_08370 [Bacteroidia bacterium]|nr:hypothetical protein [Bacteroidia bacterium]